MGIWGDGISEGREGALMVFGVELRFLSKTLKWVRKKASLSPPPPSPTPSPHNPYPKSSRNPPRVRWKSTFFFSLHFGYSSCAYFALPGCMCAYIFLRIWPGSYSVGIKKELGSIFYASAGGAGICQDGGRKGLGGGRDGKKRRVGHFSPSPSPPGDPFPDPQGSAGRKFLRGSGAIWGRGKGAGPGKKFHPYPSPLDLVGLMRWSR